MLMFSFLHIHTSRCSLKQAISLEHVRVEMLVQYLFGLNYYYYYYYYYYFVLFVFFFLLLDPSFIPPLSGKKKRKTGFPYFLRGPWLVCLSSKTLLFTNTPHLRSFVHPPWKFFVCVCVSSCRLSSSRNKHQGFTCYIHNLKGFEEGFKLLSWLKDCRPSLIGPKHIHACSLHLYYVSSSHSKCLIPLELNTHIYTDTLTHTYLMPFHYPVENDQTILLHILD